MFQEHPIDPRTAQALQQSLSLRRLPHAVILEGADDETRLAAAKDIARALVCQSEFEPPCGQCRSCKKAAAGAHPDILLIAPEKEGAFIKVDAIRALIARAQLRPNDGDKTVFILQDAQQMNVQSQNALLKLMEEPPKHVNLILTCPSKAAFLETIRSRATAFRLSNEEESLPASDEAAMAAATLLQTLCTGNELDFLLCTSSLQKEKQLSLSVFSACALLLRDALVGFADVDTLSGDEQTAAMLRGRFSRAQLLRLAAVFRESTDALNRNANLNLTLTALCSLCYSCKRAET